ncbi:MAG: hypothetical protein ABTQ26_03385 [Azonexus sp.]
MSRKKPWFLCGDDFPDAFIDDFVEKAMIPPIFVGDFDMKKFSRQVLGALSLSLEEKTRVLDALPTLSCFQCDELEKTFIEEAEQFNNLPDEFAIILRLSAATIIGACALALHRGAGIPDAAEETAMIQSMGRAKRKSSRRLQGFLKSMPKHQDVVEYVYGKTQLRHPEVPEIPEFLRKGI